MLPEESFVSQVEALIARGYRFVTASQFARQLHNGGPPSSTCALTFDDGSLDNARVLPGLLQKLSVPATLFVCPGLLGQPHPWLAPESGVRLMTAEELEEVARLELVEIGSHTNHHVDMSSLTAEEAYREMASSKHALEDRLGKPVESFAYPFGFYSRACPAAAERAGYTSAATCGLRGGWRPYELRRELIDPRDGRFRFALKTRGLFRPMVSSPPARLLRRLRTTAGNDTARRGELALGDLAAREQRAEIHRETGGAPDERLGHR
jgi:peptidoglycan/xylan/chitin deacetylase (PgdA/CDA1 family)